MHTHSNNVSCELSLCVFVTTGERGNDALKRLRVLQD